MEAPLRKIFERPGIHSSGANHFSEEGSIEQTHRTYAHGEFIHGETTPVLDGSHNLHTEHSLQPGTVWDPKARGNSVSGDYSREDPSAASMDIEGDRRGTIPYVV